MSGKVVFITGGARSGKSSFALKEASLVPGRKVFIATAEAIDLEMKERIERHRRDRGAGWKTYEEPLHVSKTIEETSERYDVLLLDCLTIWLSNIMWAASDAHGVPARKEGLGKIFTGRISMGTVVLSSCMTIIVSVFVYALWLIGEYGPSITPLPFVFLALWYLCGFLSAKYCTGKFGGVTGDIFGAISEISEIFFLLGVSAWLLRSI